MDDSSKPDIPQDIQVQMPPEMQHGTYANQLLVALCPVEFILDFILLTPPAGVVNSRVIVSPAQAKRMITALQDNVERYEATFGEINANPISSLPGEGAKRH